MFINEITSLPRYVEGRKFVERTIKSKFKKGDVSITTIYMNDRPLTKNYVFETKNIIKNVWKSMQKPKVEEITVDKVNNKVL